MAPISIPWFARAWRYRHLVRNLIAKDFKVRYQGSVLGFLWTLLTPLVMICVYMLAFKYILQIQVDNFALFLVTGILPWGFFSTALIASTESITSNSTLLKNIAFPRETLPVSTVLFQFVNLLLAYVVFFPIIAFLQAPVRLPLLGLPVLLLITLILALGFAFLLAAATVFFLDTRQISELVLMALFWLTPIVYDIRIIPDRFQRLLAFGPMTSIVIGYQDILYSGQWPAATTWLAGTAWAVGALVVGFTVFRRLQHRFAEEL